MKALVHQPLNRKSEIILELQIEPEFVSTIHEYKKRIPLIRNGLNRSKRLFNSIEIETIEKKYGKTIFQIIDPFNHRLTDTSISELLEFNQIQLSVIRKFYELNLNKKNDLKSNAARALDISIKNIDELENEIDFILKNKKITYKNLLDSTYKYISASSPLEYNGGKFNDANELYRSLWDRFYKRNLTENPYYIAIPSQYDLSISDINDHTSTGIPVGFEGVLLGKVYEEHDEHYSSGETEFDGFVGSISMFSYHDERLHNPHIYNHNWMKGVNRILKLINKEINFSEDPFSLENFKKIELALNFQKFVNTFVYKKTFANPSTKSGENSELLWFRNDHEVQDSYENIVFNPRWFLESDADLSPIDNSKSSSRMKELANFYRLSKNKFTDSNINDSIETWIYVIELSKAKHQNPEIKKIADELLKNMLAII